MRDIGELIKRRDCAADWVLYARYAAGFIAAVGCIFAGSEKSGAKHVPIVIPLVLYLAIASAASLLRPKRIWAAWLLIVLLALTFVLSAVRGTLLSGILPRLIVVGVCIKGALAVFEYGKLERLIEARKTNEVHPE